MADLLECVIQIKALADTPRRLGLYASPGGGRAGGAVEAMLAEVLVYEAWVGDTLDRALASEDSTASAPPSEPGAAAPETAAGRAPAPDAGETLRRFASLRAAVVRRLDACGARELSRVVQVPGRGPTTVADLVALALAHDTDAIAAVVREGAARRGHS